MLVFCIKFWNIKWFSSFQTSLAMQNKRQLICRFLSSDYGDGISTSRLSSTGKSLPSTRLVSIKVHKVNNFYYKIILLSHPYRISKFLTLLLSRACILFPSQMTWQYLQDGDFHSHPVTNLLVVWGQFIDHDLSLTPMTKVLEFPKRSHASKICFQLI